MEIRGEGCPSKVGKQIYLCASDSGVVTGKATVLGQKKLSKAEWDDMRPRGSVIRGAHTWMDASV